LITIDFELTWIQELCTARYGYVLTENLDKLEHRCNRVPHVYTHRYVGFLGDCVLVIIRTIAF